MSMLIMGASHGLTKEQVEPFFDSLGDSGFDGDVGLISNDLQIRGTTNLVPYEDIEYFRSSNRLFLYQEYMQKCGRRYDTVMLTGVRDVIFQSNPEEIRPKYVNLYREDDHMTIGACPYNSLWIHNTYGKAGLGKVGSKFIICAEIVIATWDGMVNFLRDMTEHATKQRNKHVLEDQAMLNYLFHTDQLPYAQAVHNEVADVYTVGYCKNITVSKHKIVNQNGMVPAVVHQYDRHINLL